MKRFIVATGLFLALLPTALSIGVSSPPFEDNTIVLEEGTVQPLVLTLQNPENYDMKVEFSVSSAIARVENPQAVYTLPAGTYDNQVRILIEPPSGTGGGLHELRYSITPLTSQGGNIPITGGISKKYDVRVTRAPEPEPVPSTVPMIPILIAVTLALIIVWRYAGVRNR